MTAAEQHAPITIWAPENINQSTAEYLAELIRVGGIRYLEANPTKTLHEGDWRGNPFMDGIAVDLDDTGLPIDFQIQRRTAANTLHAGPRRPLVMPREEYDA